MLDCLDKFLKQWVLAIIRSNPFEITEKNAHTHKTAYQIWGEWEIAMTLIYASLKKECFSKCNLRFSASHLLEVLVKMLISGRCPTLIKSQFQEEKSAF